MKTSLTLQHLRITFQNFLHAEVKTDNVPSHSHAGFAAGHLAENSSPRGCVVFKCWQRR